MKAERIKSLLLSLIIITFVLVFFNVFVKLCNALPEATADMEKPITVCVTMEKFTLGQGYIIEPTLVKVDDQTMASLVITDLLKARYPVTAQPWKMTGSLEEAFYLSSVYDPDHGSPVFPAYISKKADLNPEGGTEDWLGEFDYYNMSGWMYSVNDIFPNVGAAEWRMSDGEVMRWQFTLYGYGSDLGADNSEWGSADITNVGNKDDLTWAVALCNSVYDQSLLTSNERYINALAVLQDMEAEQATIDSALTNLKEDGPRFSDVAKDAWYKDAVDFVLDNALFNGTSTISFSPQGTLTRAMAVTVLYRLAGEPVVIPSSPVFSDISGEEWYEAAVSWAADHNLTVELVSDGSFEPDRIITREQLAGLLYRYAALSDPALPANGDLSAFLDGGEVSQAYREAVAWAVDEGILQGTDNKLLPGENLTRAQFATMMMRFSQDYE